MRLKTGFLLIVCLFMGLTTATAQKMNNNKLYKLMKKEGEGVDGKAGNWQLFYQGRILLVLTDEDNNRMRIFTPIVEENDLERGQMKKMLEANFLSALDAKYSLFNEYVISVYTHPLKELTKDQMVDAMQQVVLLADTFGSSYSSTGITYDSSPREEKIDQTQKEDKKVNKKPAKSN